MPTEPGTHRPPGPLTTEPKGVTDAIDRWFARNARELPWRSVPLGQPRDRYHALVSEVMLQQTQVARVVEKFTPFLERFPTIVDLADAPEDEVLSAWSGLGYYRRAKNLHAAAKDIVERFGGAVPSNAADLATIPGIGRYTAGAIASIASGHPAPIVDGNVARVLIRLEGEDLAHGSPDAARFAWEHAARLVSSAKRPGVFNEGLMELGATVCTPRAPRCLFCPVQDRCVAHQTGREDEIPTPKARTTKREIFVCSVICHDSLGRLRVEQRDAEGQDAGLWSGLWSGLWQALSVEHDRAFPSPKAVREALGVTGLQRVDEFTHETTHRTVRFRVYGCDGGSPTRGEWRSVDEIERLALSSPQKRILLDR